MTLWQLIRRPQTTEEREAQLKFYQSIAFGILCTMIAALITLLTGALIYG